MHQQDYEHTEQMQDLMDALARAQAQMKNPVTDQPGPHPKSRYASLAAVRDAIMPALAAEGIALTQLPLTSETHVGCTTVLWHKGQYLKSTLRLPQAKADPHAYGSALTYARRYALLAICNIAGEDDDDGQGARRGQRQADEEATRRRAEEQRQQAEAAARAEEQRQERLREIHDVYKAAILPLKHAGMYKAIVFHAFHLDKPEQITQLSIEALEAGMPLYQHLTAHLLTWDRKTSDPETWIAAQVQQLATEAGDKTAVPDGVDPATGEDHREMPDDWMTDDERREQAAREAAAQLAQTTA